MGNWSEIKQPKDLVPPLPAEEQGKPQEPANPSARVLGLDVAKYQDKLDLAEMKKLKARGYEFVFAKATDGARGVDAYYKMHRENAKAAGMLLGAYHFLRFGADAVGQAKHFHATAKRVKGDLPPVLDVEWDRFTTGLNGKSYGKDTRMDKWAEEHAKKCVEAIAVAFGVKPIIYTNAFFWPSVSAFPDFWKQHLVWVPSYADSMNPGGVHLLENLSPEALAKAGANVKIPSGWKQWNFWQDEDDLAIGDVKAIDTNVFRGSLDELRKIAAV